MDLKAIQAILLVCILAVLLLFISPFAMAGQQKVLLLYSYNDELPWQKSLRNGLHTRLAELNNKSQLFEERLDKVRLKIKPAEQAWAEYLRQKYSSIDFDMVIAESEAAARLLVHSPELFGSARRYLVNHEDVQPGLGKENTIVVKDNFRQSLQVALDLSPQASRLVFISNLNSKDSEVVQQIWQQHFADRVSFESWSDDFSFDELYKRASMLSLDTVIVYAPVNHDRTGARAVPYRVLGNLVREASVPVFTTHDTLLGSGSVGGYLMSSERIGRAMADVIAGASPNDFSNESFFINMFDIRALQRWQIDESQLPAGSRVQFRQPTFYERNRQLIIYGLPLIILETLILFALVYVLRARRLSMRALDDSHKLLEEKVVERTKELQEAKYKADAASQAKSEFLSSMSHELRTPLNAILGFGQILEVNLKGEDKGDAEEIVKAGNHLLSLINEILDLARIESGRITVAIKDLSLQEILYECLSILRPLADERGIDIIDNISGNGERIIRADDIRIKQVLMNLISNAIKYNEENGSIILDCEPVGSGRLRIKITDTGKGLTKDQIDHLFRPFERVGRENSSIEGTGIGLAISKKLVVFMDGDIGVESKPGAGATFWVDIKLS